MIRCLEISYPNNPDKLIFRVGIDSEIQAMISTIEEQPDLAPTIKVVNLTTDQWDAFKKGTVGYEET